MNDKKILITGCAGFIGMHLAKRMLTDGYSIIGIDNLSEYYDVTLKKSRLKLLNEFNNFVFVKAGIEDAKAVNKLFSEYSIDTVINLAAQAGVRYSLINPNAYIESNIVGFMNILEACRHHNIRHLLFASSSSVYGGNKTTPFSTNQNVDHPLSLYAATKKSNELMAHTYSHLYNLPVTGLRFFTVYGPWGRPDMALFLFTKAILDGQLVKVFNNGLMKRDFTYIDDIVEGIARLIHKIPKPNPGLIADNLPGSSFAPYKIYNIGNNNPVALEDFISALENALGKKAIKEYLPLQPGDVSETYADIDELVEVIGFKPGTPINEGIEKFVKWYRDYYRVGI